MFNFYGTICNKHILTDSLQMLNVDRCLVNDEVWSHSLYINVLEMWCKLECDHLIVESYSLLSLKTGYGTDYQNFCR